MSCVLAVCALYPFSGYASYLSLAKLWDFAPKHLLPQKLPRTAEEQQKWIKSITRN
jgi:hypothetical protein